MVRFDTVLTGVQVFVVLIALSLLLTGCTERWNGDRPGFMVRAIVAAVGLNIFVMVHWPECKLTITAIIITVIIFIV